jgi:hypothetical protein
LGSLAIEEIVYFTKIFEGFLLVFCHSGVEHNYLVEIWQFVGPVSAFIAIVLLLQLFVIAAV